MDNLYLYESMMEQRRAELERSMSRQRALVASREGRAGAQPMSSILNELTQSRRVLRLGRIVIMW